MTRNRQSYLLIFLLIFILVAGGCRPDQQEGKDADPGNREKEDSTAIGKSREIIRTRSLGLAYLEENKLEEAEAEFRKLISLAPDEALGYANLGIVYMRMGKYDEAEQQLQKAISLNPDDPDIRFNLAQVYDLVDKEVESRKELEKSIEQAPDHLQSLYGLAESYQGQTDAQSILQWEKYLKRIAESSPSNIVARLYLVEALVRNERLDEALSNLEEIERISPKFPAEATEYYRSSMDQLRNHDAAGALTSVMILHNLMKLTNQYQTDIQQLKGPGASRVGTPVISFSESRPVFLMEGESLLDALQFNDVTASASLDILNALVAQSGNPITMAVADMDRDGDQDLYISGFDASRQKYSHFLLENNMGRFQDIAEPAGLDHEGMEAGAVFTDYNNDGFLDLYIIRDQKNLLYANVSEGVFEEVGESAGIADDGQGSMALFFDMDQEGDLDLFLGNRNSIRIYLNRGDETFGNITAQVNFGDRQAGCRDAVIGDVDDDGDVDLLMITQEGQRRLFANERDLNYADITENSGLKNKEGTNAADMGDYNNDGFPDLLIAGSGTPFQLFMNKADGTFSPDPSVQQFLNALPVKSGHDVLFFDFDNDGYQDMLLAGEPSGSDGKGIFLLHNDTRGNFTDVSEMLPEDVRDGTKLAVFDYNEDGDMDMLIAGGSEGIKLIRNDGGNANHHLKIQLVGIKTGSGKNNYFGIGAKVEVRAGELYQMKTVTSPNIHFGLGRFDKVDVVRILWTNGVPQNIFSPGSDQDLIEEQELKGSCPFVYAWDGEKYDFVKDMMWRSALGMPLGIMGKESRYAFPGASFEYLKIPSEALQPENHQYSLQITAELWETIYFDKFRLIAVDHPASDYIEVDESFVPPPYPPLKIYQVRDRKYPRQVLDDKGRDQTELVLKKDNQYIAGFNKDKYQGLAESHELILELDEYNGAGELYLFLNGWIFPTDASINVNMSQSEKKATIPPYLQVQDTNGNWETLIENIGFPMGKNKTVTVDLSGKMTRKNPKLRIVTNMEIYWDHIYYATSLVEGSASKNTLKPVYADLHYRGFSGKFRKGGRYGPHWFAYDHVSTSPAWRDLKGMYTRYGDVMPLLEEADNRYIIMNAGDEVTVRFDASGLPDLKPGWTRDFLIFSVGWVKDGDMNTAHGSTVEPLPYHGMKAYPYAEADKYPETIELKTYHRKYNTRKVTGEAFRNEIRGYGE